CDALFKDFGGRDRSHASVVDGTVAQHARGTVRRMANDNAGGAERARGHRVCWPEEYDGGRSYRRPNVRGASVVRDQQVRHTDQAGDFGHGSLSGKYDWIVPGLSANLFRNFFFTR